MALGGSHSVGSFVPPDLEKAQRRRRARRARHHVYAQHADPHALPNMNITWRASSIESKKRGDLRGPESGGPR